MKRLLDLTASCAGLVMLSPLFCVVAAAIKLDNPGPVFFRQARAGKDGRTFRVYKFRTMVVDAEHKGAGVFIEKDDPRITRVGKFLRSLSIDELPQLINIMKGEMSLVGPRPTLPYQVDNYNERQRRRLLVLPGITGWAQVNGRNELTWTERVELDIWYVDNRDFWLDLKILLKTCSVVFNRAGIYREIQEDPIAGKPVYRRDD